jgi:hypothetical protein
LHKANPLHCGIANLLRIARAIDADLEDLARDEVVKRIIAIHQLQPRSARSKPP